MRRVSYNTIRIFAAAGLLAAGLAPAAQAAHSCSKATLKGSYGSVLTGTVIGVGPFATVAVVTFEGNGVWSYTESGNFNGNPIPHQTFVGTYSVASNCSGSASDSAGNTLDFVIVGGGKKVLMVGTGHGAVFTVDMKKISGSDD